MGRGRRLQYVRRPRRNVDTDWRRQLLATAGWGLHRSGSGDRREVCRGRPGPRRLQHHRVRAGVGQRRIRERRGHVETRQRGAFPLHHHHELQLLELRLKRVRQPGAPSNADDHVGCEVDDDRHHNNEGDDHDDHDELAAGLFPARRNYGRGHAHVDELCERRRN